MAVVDLPKTYPISADVSRVVVVPGPQKGSSIGLDECGVLPTQPMYDYKMILAAVLFDAIFYEGRTSFKSRQKRSYPNGHSKNGNSANSESPDADSEFSEKRYRDYR